MSTSQKTNNSVGPVPQTSSAPALQRACACGQHSHGEGECAECKKKREGTLQRAEAGPAQGIAPPVVHEVLRSSGQPLDGQTRAAMEPRFEHDFSQVRVHTGAQAAESARAVNALAYTVGRNVVFGGGQYAPGTQAGQRLLAHELTHVVQQGGGPAALQSRSLEIDPHSSLEHEAEQTAATVLSGGQAGPLTSAAGLVQRRAAPYIKKVTVHLTPPQTAQLEWEGSPPTDATGSDSFTVSTGKGYSNPGDPAGTCTRDCCTDAATQCAPPWNRPGQVGACCTYYGNTFWTGRPLEEHNGWKWWTPIQPYYSARGIALHQHHEVTGQPIGHGCVRMDEPNAKRIYDYSNGTQTNVTIDGRAAPVQCEDTRRCAPRTGTGSGARGAIDGPADSDEAATMLAQNTPAPVPGLEGELT